MSACGRRQAGISQQTQSLLAIVVPPLLMKPSLTNADECRLVNTESGATRGEGQAFIQPPSPPQPSHCFEEDEHSCINPVCCVLSLARLRRWGRTQDGLTYQKSCCGVTVSCCKAAGMTVMCSSEPSVLPGMHTVVSFPSLYRAIKRSGVDKCCSYITALMMSACSRLNTSKVHINTMVMKIRYFMEAN